MTRSVRSRFFFTVGANLLRGLLSFATGMLLARLLGPRSYGDMAFLLGAFLGIRQLLDAGTSTAFFTFLSQRSRSRRFVARYFQWLGLQFVLPLLLIALLFPAQWVATVWHGQSRLLVLLAFAASFMQNGVWPVVQQAGESQRQTFLVQGVGVAIAAVHVLAVLALWWLGTLGLYAIFIALALEYFVGAVIAQRRFQYALPAIPGQPPAAADAAGAGPAMDEDALGPMVRKYLAYCLPLLPYSIVGFAYEFADRWLLQNYGGGVQQAFYAVGAQFASIALIATTSILRIFWKEVAEADHRGDHVRTGVLYKRVSRLLFLIGAVTAGFLLAWSKELLGLVLGAAYAGGATTLAVMFLYPVHQSMGQIGSTMLYATERVKLQVIIGVAFMASSIVVTYFVLAPKDAAVPGLGLASTGLALKMVVLQFIQVNLIAWLIARIWKWPFDWIYQPVSLLGCLALGWLAHDAALAVTGAGWPLPLVMALSGLLYVAMATAFVYAMPWLGGMTRAELRVDAGKLWRMAFTYSKSS